jgi:MscS family membrane protein
MKLLSVLRGLICLLILLSLPFSPLAQEAFPEQPAPAAQASEKVPVPSALASPRATMATFLHAMNDIKRGDPERIGDAITTLDLSSINTIVRRERGEDLAWTLLEVLDRTRIIVLEEIPDSADGNPYVVADYFIGKVTLSRVTDGRWLFDRETVAKLPQILDKLSNQRRLKGSEQDEVYLPLHIRMRQAIPENLKKSVLLLENWQWIGLFLLVLVGVVADKLLSMALRALIRQWKSRTRHGEYRNLSDQILRPLGLMAMAVIWWLGINLMGLPENALLILLVAVKFLASISGVWAAYRLVDLIGLRLIKYAAQTENKLDDALMPLIPRVLKVFITVIGFVFIADNLNMDVSSLLAGLGLGGLAFALAAKDMVQNLFGSVTVLLDRTFTVGDWVIVGDVEGSVEQIGFRSTRIRTFYNSVVTVPNSKFITAEVDNMGERRYRRLSCKLSLTYDTPPEKIEAFCEGVRELIRLHPYMRKDYYQVYLNEFAASSLEVMLYVFWSTPEWNTELRERHRFLLDILRLAQRLGVEFAFPTQTLYMKSESDAGGGGSEAALTAAEAEAQGRDLARAIVDETLGRGVKPPPVVFPRVE